MWPPPPPGQQGHQTTPTGSTVPIVQLGGQFVNLPFLLSVNQTQPRPMVPLLFGASGVSAFVQQQQPLSGLTTPLTNSVFQQQNYGNFFVPSQQLPSSLPAFEPASFWQGQGSHISQFQISGGQLPPSNTSTSSTFKIIDYGHGHLSDPSTSATTSSLPPPLLAPPPPPPQPPPPPPPPRVVNIDHLLLEPARLTRPARIVIILRGLPGSGKSYIARAIRDKELAISKESAIRILSIDEYFMQEIQEKDRDSGKKVSKMVYEYDAAMASVYRQALLKSFKKTVDDCLFSFLIIDAVNDKIQYFDEFVAYAASRGYATYVGAVTADVDTCVGRSHGRFEETELRMVSKFWEATPSAFLQVDLTPLVNPDIDEVEMQEEGSDNEKLASKRKIDEIDEASSKRSKWDDIVDTGGQEKMNRLDGIRMSSMSSKSSDGDANEDDFNALGTDSAQQSPPSSELATISKRKRVSWADVNQYRKRLSERGPSYTELDRMMAEVDARAVLVKIHHI